VAALAKIADRAFSQTWSRYFYEQTAIYGIIDGICYFNAHNDETAIAPNRYCERNEVERSNLYPSDRKLPSSQDYTGKLFKVLTPRHLYPK
jgi:hypothetical protein